MSAPDWLTARPIAHRGLHAREDGIIENSLQSAEAAIAKGFAIELDVQNTADGDAVVFHDFALERLTGESGEVQARTAAELSSLTLTGASDRIPVFTDYLAHIAGRTPLVVEIKSRFDGDLRLTERVIAILGGYSGPYAIKSFDPVIVAALRTRAPQVPRGIVAQGAYDYAEWSDRPEAAKFALANLLHVGETDPDFLSWRVGDLPHACAALFRHFGRPVMTWTVRTEEDRRRAAAHADQMVFEGFVP